MPTGALRPPWQMTDAELIAEAEAIQAAEDQAALSDPATLMRHLQPNTYRKRRHLRVISAALADVGAGVVDRLVITTPPQVGKTVTAVVGGAFWWLANHPAHRVIVGSYGNTLAINRGRSVRKLVIEHGHKYDLRLEAGSAAVNDWSLTTGGGMKSVGVGGGVTGNPGDLALIDDPHKSRAEANSMVIRDKVYDWYSDDVVSRLAPGAPIVLIMTRWHPDDLVARVLADEGREDEGGRWRVIHMPALCTDPDRDPLGRTHGEPLPHPKIKAGDKAAALRHWEDKKRTTSVRGFAAMYQGDPQPEEGALLTRKLLRERRCYAHGAVCGPCETSKLKVAVAVDPSGGGRDTAGVIGGYLGTDKRLYLTHDSSGHMPSDEWARAACELAATTDADRIIVEKNYGGDMALLAVRTAWDALRDEELERLGGDVHAETYTQQAKYNRLAPRIVPVTGKRNKLLRAEPVAQQWIEDRVRTAAYLPDVEEEWATWQPDDPNSPGRIDASVYLALGLLRPPPASLGGQVTHPPQGSLPTTGASPLAGDGGPSGPFSSLG